jgi:hypothetical protein
MMIDFITQHLSEISSFLAGMVGGSLLTFQFMRNRVQGSGSIVDQNRARASGDIVGGDKTTRNQR